MTHTVLHPSLQRPLAAHRHLLRLLSLLIFLPMAGMMVFAMATALHGDTLGDLLLLALIGGIVLVMVVSLGGLLAWLNHWTTQRLLDANRLLLESSPITARLTPTDFNSKQGMLMAVHCLDPRAVDGTGYILIEPYLSRSRPPPEDITVQLYCQDLQPGRQVVALQEGNTLLGKSVDRQQYLRQRRWMMIALVAAALLAVIVVFLER